MRFSAACLLMLPILLACTGTPEAPDDEYYETESNNEAMEEEQEEEVREDIDR